MTKNQEEPGAPDATTLIWSRTAQESAVSTTFGVKVVEKRLKKEAFDFPDSLSFTF